MNNNILDIIGSYDTKNSMFRLVLLICKSVFSLYIIFFSFSENARAACAALDQIVVLTTGTHTVTVDGSPETLHVDNDGTHSWLLVGVAGTAGSLMLMVRELLPM